MRIEKQKDNKRIMLYTIYINIFLLGISGNTLTVVARPRQQVRPKTRKAWQSGISRLGTLVKPFLYDIDTCRQNTLRRLDIKDLWDPTKKKRGRKYFVSFGLHFISLHLNLNFIFGGSWETRKENIFFFFFFNFSYFIFQKRKLG